MCKFVQWLGDQQIDRLRARKHVFWYLAFSFSIYCCEDVIVFSSSYSWLEKRTVKKRKERKKIKKEEEKKEKYSQKEKEKKKRRKRKKEKKEKDRKKERLKEKREKKVRFF